MPEPRQLAAGGGSGVAVVEDDVSIAGCGFGRRLRAVPGTVPGGGLVGYAVLVLGRRTGAVRVHTWKERVDIRI